MGNYTVIRTKLGYYTAIETQEEVICEQVYEYAEVIFTGLSYQVANREAEDRNIAQRQGYGR